MFLLAQCDGARKLFGVEGGQVTIIAAAMLTVSPFIRKSWYRRVVVLPASCAIAAIGVYWTITRLLT